MRERFRLWLINFLFPGGVAAGQAYRSMAPETMAMRIMKLETHVHEQLDFQHTDSHNALLAIQELDAKFNCLARTLGIHVVYKDEQTVLADIVDNGLLGHSQRYLESVLVADKLVGLRYRSLVEEMKLLATLQRKDSHVPGSSTVPGKKTPIW